MKPNEKSTHPSDSSAQQKHSTAPHIHHHIVRHDLSIGWNRKYTTILLYILLGILFTAICIYFLIHTDHFSDLSLTLGNIATPILIGFALAYILNPCMEFCENHLFAGKAQHRYNRARRKLMKAKLAYDQIRLSEYSDESSVAQSKETLRLAHLELAESKQLAKEADAKRIEAFYQKQAKKRKKPSFHKEKVIPPEHPHRLPALLCTFGFFLLLVITFLAIVVPQCISSINDLIVLIRYYAETLPLRFQSIQLPSSLTSMVDSLNENFDMKDTLVELGMKGFNYVGGLLASLLAKIPQFLSNTVSIVTNTILGIFMAIYFLSSKEMLLYQVSLFTKVFAGKKGFRFLRRVAKETDRQFGRFIQGKLIDSLLMTVVCILLFTIGGIPYAAMITLITVITNLIPYFGPFIGAIPSGIIILIKAPSKLLVFAILILIIQQIEGNILEPRILGNSMGLAPVWIMVAVLVMGELFGILGMILGVPFFSVFYTLIGHYCRKRLAKRKIAATPSPTSPLEDE